MAELITITDWDKHFEINRTRELKCMTWLALPNRLDGDGYTELVDHQDGASHFGAWIILLEVASRCDPRGTLIRDNGEPHTPQSLARMSRLPAVVFEQVIPRLQVIGWIEVTQIPQEGAITPQVDAAIPHEGVPTNKQTNTTEQDNTKQSKQVMLPEILSTDIFKAAWANWLGHLKEKKKNPTDRAVTMQLKKLEAMGHDRAIAAIENSIAGNYQGLFEAGQTSGYARPSDINAATQRRADKAKRENAEPVRSRLLG